MGIRCVLRGYTAALALQLGITDGDAPTRPGYKLFLQMYSQIESHEQFKASF